MDSSRCRVKSFERVMNKWQKAYEVRNFIQAVEKRLKRSDLIDPNDISKTEEWLEWSRDYAERLDPPAEGVPFLIKEEDCNRWDLY